MNQAGSPSLLFCGDGDMHVKNDMSKKKNVQKATKGKERTTTAHAFIPYYICVGAVHIPFLPSRFACFVAIFEFLMHLFGASNRTQLIVSPARSHVTLFALCILRCRMSSESSSSGSSGGNPLAMPAASVTRIIKTAVGDMHVSTDVKAALGKAASVFILYLTSMYV